MCTVRDINVSKSYYVYMYIFMHVLNSMCTPTRILFYFSLKGFIRIRNKKIFPNFLAKNHLDLAGVVGKGGVGQVAIFRVTKRGGGRGGWVAGCAGEG
jgi:hypothetical protein